MGLVLCFAGRIASGKSSVSHALAATLGWPCTGFGDFLRAELTRRGENLASREALQDLGQAMVDTDANAFCRAVLAAGGFVPGGDLLLEGIRHVAIQQIITRIALPSNTKLIYLSVDDVSRFERVGDRADGRSDFARAESHQVEADLRDSLPAIADATIDARNDLSVVVAECLSLIESWRRSAA